MLYVGSLFSLQGSAYQPKHQMLCILSHWSLIAYCDLPVGLRSFAITCRKATYLSEDETVSPFIFSESNVGRIGKVWWSIWFLLIISSICFLPTKISSLSCLSQLFPKTTHGIDSYFSISGTHCKVCMFNLMQAWKMFVAADSDFLYSESLYGYYFIILAFWFWIIDVNSPMTEICLLSPWLNLKLFKSPS